MFRYPPQGYPNPNFHPPVGYQAAPPAGYAQPPPYHPNAVPQAGEIHPGQIPHQPPQQLPVSKIFFSHFLIVPRIFYSFLETATCCTTASLSTTTTLPATASLSTTTTTIPTTAAAISAGSSTTATSTTTTTTVSTTTTP